MSDHGDDDWRPPVTIETSPGPAAEGSLALLVARMNLLRGAVGSPTLDRLDELATEHLPGQERLPPQTLSPILNGKRLPRWGTLWTFVRACEQASQLRRIKVAQELLDQKAWRGLWDEARLQTSRTDEAESGEPEERTPVKGASDAEGDSRRNAPHDPYGKKQGIAADSNKDVDQSPAWLPSITMEGCSHVTIARDHAVMIVTLSSNDHEH